LISSSHQHTESLLQHDQRIDGGAHDHHRRCYVFSVDTFEIPAGIVQGDLTDSALHFGDIRLCLVPKSFNLIDLLGDLVFHHNLLHFNQVKITRPVVAQ